MQNKNYYRVIQNIVAQNIRAGRLPEGTVLYVAAVADRLALSRPPVVRALEVLADSGLLTRHPQQGYVVGKLDPDQPVVPRANLYTLDLDLSQIENGGAPPVAPRWEAIRDEVEQATLDTIPFGTFQLSETGICDHFAVSRTVAREVLVRLNSQGLIQKSRSSHWIAGQLSARILDEAHQIRRRLEPDALTEGATYLPSSRIAAMLDLIAQAGDYPDAATFERIETDLHDEIPGLCRNRSLVEVLGRLRFARVVNRMFDANIRRRDGGRALFEHRLVFEHLQIGDLDGAARSLQMHLDHDHHRTRDRLKVLSLFDQPVQYPYLIRIH